MMIKLKDLVSHKVLNEGFTKKYSWEKDGKSVLNKAFAIMSKKYVASKGSQYTGGGRTISTKREGIYHEAGAHTIVQEIHWWEKPKKGMFNSNKPKQQTTSFLWVYDIYDSSSSLYIQSMDNDPIEKASDILDVFDDRTITIKEKDKYGI